MTITGSCNFEQKTFILNNIQNTENHIAVTNNLLSLTYRNESNELVTYRKNINNFVNIDKGNLLTSSNIKDNNNLGGFAKITKSTTKRNYHFGKTLVDIDWEDSELNNKYNVLEFVDSNGNNRKAVRTPCYIS